MEEILLNIIKQKIENIKHKQSIASKNIRKIYSREINILEDVLNDFKDINTLIDPTNKLSETLREYQNLVIGYAIIYSNVKVIIDKKEDFLTLISVGNSLGLQTDYITECQCDKVIYFPDNKTLTDMMKDPIVFNDWYEENIS